MDQRQVIELLDRYSKLVLDNFEVKKIVLYGSYAKDTAKEDSDIDVAVIVKNIKEDFLTSEAKLFKLRRKVDYRIEPILFEEEHDNSGFLDEILKTGRIVYQTSENNQVAEV